MAQTTWVGDSFGSEEFPASTKFNEIIGGDGDDASLHIGMKLDEIDTNIDQVKRQIAMIRINTSGEGLTDVWEKAVFVAPQALDLYKIGIVADIAFGDNTDFSTLSIINKGASGVGTDVVVTKAFDSEITIFDFVDFGALSGDYKDMVAGDTLTLEKTYSASGEAVEDLVLFIEYDIDISA